MIEDGPDSFTQQWRRFAAEATLFGRPEGSPLLEIEVAGVVLQLLERTNPYLGMPGRARVLVQPSTDDLEVCGDGDEGTMLEVPWRGALRAQGPVLHREGRLLVVDAGTPLVVDVRGLADGDGPRPGAHVRFMAMPPIHGFVLPRERRTGGPRERDVDEAP